MSGIAQLRQIATAIIEDNKSLLTADDAVCIMTAAELLSEGAPAVTREGPLLFCCGCFASNEDGSWGHTCDENYCYNCGHGPIIQIPRHAVESIRQQASWVGKRYYPHDEDTEIATELQALRSLRERLMVALARYELDEPHWGDGPLSQNECDHLTAEKLAEWLEQEHDGDCTGEAHTCRRCLAEHWRHKADWIARVVSAERGEEVPNGETT